MKKKFYSCGKLLLTSEYLVLDGAKALAIPTKKGQSLSVIENDSKLLIWKSYDCYGKLWYETQITLSDLLSKTPPESNNNIDKTLFTILRKAHHLSKKGLDPNKGYFIETHLEFERLWGLGTSSTLINNIADWFSINAFELLELSFGGSGYDIAVAKSNTPILFQRTYKSDIPKVTRVPEFSPSFKEELFFVYLNNKMDSKKAILTYRSRNKIDIQKFVQQSNLLTEAFLEAKNVQEFEELIDQHEQLISGILDIPTIKDQRFSDFKGSIKSLGGWGGDFVLVTGGEDARRYFLDKGYKTIVSYMDMLLSGV